MGNLLQTLSPSFKIMMTGIDSNVEDLAWYIDRDFKEKLVTIGMTVRILKYKNLLINNWYRDRVADKKYHMAVGRSYFTGNNGLIFVIDAGSQEELDWYYESQKQIFEDITRDDMYKNMPILIIANKQEKEHAIKAKEIKEKWKLDELLEGRTWIIMDSRSNSTDDLGKSLDWMVEQMIKK